MFRNYWVRRKLIPPSPTTRDTMPDMIPEFFTHTTVRNEQVNTLLYYDNYMNERNELSGKILIMGTREDVIAYRNSNMISGDGTFLSCPLMFYQLFTFGTFISKGTIGNKDRRIKLMCRLYCLLPCKSAHCYIKVLNIIDNLVKNHILMKTIMLMIMVM